MLGIACWYIDCPASLNLLCFVFGMLLLMLQYIGWTISTVLSAAGGHPKGLDQTSFIDQKCDDQHHDLDIAFGDSAVAMA